MSKMIAYVTNSYGPDAHFEEARVPIPELGNGQILIEVRATSVNPIDNKLLRANIGLNPELPAILHGDVSGVVSTVADDVTDFKPGDEVYGCAGGFLGSGGALAEYMAVDADLMSLKPKSVGFAEAAALPLVSITAWESLISSARMVQGENVLVHGGVGGVGHIAAQIANAKGALTSVTVSSEADAKLANSLGIERTINYKKESVEDYVARLTGGEGFDLIYDTVGGDNLEVSLQATKTYGRVVTVFTGTDSPIIDLTTAYYKALAVHTQNMSIPLVTGLGRKRHGEILKDVAALVDDGKVRPLIDPSEFDFSQVNEAHARLAARQHRGKIVLKRQAS